MYTVKAHMWPGSDKLGKKEGVEGGRQGRRWRTEIYERHLDVNRNGMSGDGE